VVRRGISQTAATTVFPRDEIVTLILIEFEIATVSSVVARMDAEDHELEVPAVLSDHDLLMEDVGGPIPSEYEGRLIITKMVLENFKSYGGVKEIGPFHSSMSAVVGPNGSGKSNVIDALLFVFGKRASKLRLKKVSELIHKSRCGVCVGRALCACAARPCTLCVRPSPPAMHLRCLSTYPSLESAKVSVFFQRVRDNEDGSCEAIPDSDVIIAREAWRNNSSRYYVNGKGSNFTEVTTLLRSFGVDLDNNRFLILQVGA
jgi:structural maintenance of chromosome 4